MKLSIIIPFNRYIHYLYDCLESIKDQNLTDYEVLLVVDTIEDVYEPYLIQIGFIARTLRGRMVLPPAYKHLGYDYKGE